MTKPFTRHDVGCYADGAFGHQHCREVLADLLGNVPNSTAHGFLGEPGGTVDALQAALRSEMSDDAWEEDRALDALNSLCADDVYFVFENGDLLLLEVTP